MSDRFIDREETQIYGPYAAKKIRSECLGLIKEFDPALTYVADGIDKATAAAGAALGGSRTAGAGVRKGAVERKPALSQALDLLGRFSKHLGGHAKGVIDPKVYFTDDGTLAGLGRSTPHVLLALSNISLQLADEKSPVKDKATWAAEIKAAIAGLAPVAEHADNAKTDLRESTPALDAARAAWLQTYASAKSLVESLFRLIGKLELMPAIFNDLAQPANAKVTQPPVEPAPTK